MDMIPFFVNFLASQSLSFFLIVCFLPFFYAVLNGGVFFFFFFLQTRLLALPACLFGNQLGCPLTDSQHGQHRVDTGHLGEDAGVGDANVLQTTDFQLRVDHGQRIARYITHLGGTGRVVDRMGGAATILGQLLVGLDLGARGNLPLDPVLEWRLLGDLPGGLEAGDDGGGIVAFGVGEVAEVQRGLYRGIRGGQVDATTRAGAGDVGGHAEGVHGSVVPQTLGVEAEGNLVAVHHDIGGATVGAGGIRSLPAQENAGVGIHGGLVGGDRTVELPNNDGLRVIEQVFTNSGKILDHRDTHRRQLVLRAQAGQKHQSRGIHGTRTEDGLLLGPQGVLCTRLQGHVDTRHTITVHVHTRHPGIGEDGQIRPVFLTAQDGMDVGDAGAASAAIVRVVRHVEETNALGQLSLRADDLVEIRNDWDIHGGRARLDPILAQLVAVAFMHGLEGVAQVVQKAGEGPKGPALATLLLPPLAVIFERAEGNESVVAGAATEDFGTRMADMAVACSKLENPNKN